MSLRKGIVVAAHPNDHSVDLVMSDDGSRIPGVPVMAHSASARTGGVDMPDVPTAKGADKWDITKRTGQDMEAVVAFFGRNPVVIGFLYPQVSQMTFDDPKRKFVRHQSDVYHTIDGDGNMELYHPSGAYVRIAENLDHEDLEKKNTDKSMQLDRNKDKKVGMRVSLGGVTFDIKDGVVTINAKRVVVPSGDVVASGVSVKDHIHSGVRAGPDLSGPPIGGVDAGAGSSGGGKSGPPSSPGTKDGAVVGNGIPADAEGIYKQAVQTRVPYLGEPNFTGVTGMVNAYQFRGLPKRPSLIDEETYRARVRPAATGIYGTGEMLGLVSEFDPETGMWTDDVINITDGKVGVFSGPVGQGILDYDVSGPFDVFQSDNGNFYAKYCNWNFVIFGRNSITVGSRPVFWKLTEDEYA